MVLQLTSNSCHILPPVSTSNHDSILFSICQSVSVNTDLPGPSCRRVSDQADFKSANLLLSSIPWDSLLSDSDVNYSWSVFKEVFLNIMNRTIPTKVSYSTTHPPLDLFGHLSKAYSKAKPNTYT